MECQHRWHYSVSVDEHMMIRFDDRGSGDAVMMWMVMVLTTMIVMMKVARVVAVLMMTPVYAGASNRDEGNRQLTSATLMGTGNETSLHGY